MSTRAQVRFATREEGVSFNEHPDKIHAQFYVHSDGYPEGLGCVIADSLLQTVLCSLDWEIEDLQTQHGDFQAASRGNPKPAPRRFSLNAQLLTRQPGQSCSLRPQCTLRGVGRQPALPDAPKEM